MHGVPALNISPVARTLVAQTTQAAMRQAGLGLEWIGAYLWANRPSASSNSGAVITVTDIGVAGSYWRSDGTRWYPLGGSAVLAAGNVGVSAGGNTNENALVPVTIPGGALGVNGSIGISTGIVVTNSGNAKTFRIRLGGASGTIFFQQGNQSLLHAQPGITIFNRNSVSSQVSNTSIDAVNTGALVTGALDTSVDQVLVLSFQKASAGEAATIERYRITISTP